MIEKRKVEVEMYKCDCGYEWIPRVPNPRICPGCRKYIGSRAVTKLIEHTCGGCDYKWSSRRENPKRCPRCQRWLFLPPKKLKHYKCLLCKDEWDSTRDVKNCPRCQRGFILKDGVRLDKYVKKDEVGRQEMGGSTVGGEQAPTQ